MQSLRDLTPTLVRFDFSVTPLELNPRTTYWLGIGNSSFYSTFSFGIDPSGGTSLFSTQGGVSMQPAVATTWSYPLNWSSDPSLTLAYELAGTVIPEPGQTVAAVGSLILGWALLRLVLRRWRAEDA